MNIIEKLEKKLRNEMSTRMEDNDIVEILEVLQTASQDVKQLRESLSFYQKHTKNIDDVFIKAGLYSLLVEDRGDYAKQSLEESKELMKDMEEELQKEKSKKEVIGRYLKGNYYYVSSIDHMKKQVWLRIDASDELTQFQFDLHQDNQGSYFIDEGAKVYLDFASSLQEIVNNLGDCSRIGCESKATTHGFVVLRPENEGDEPNFHPVIACDKHAKVSGFFKTTNREEVK